MSCLDFSLCLGTCDTGVAVYLFMSWNLFRDVFNERQIFVLRLCKADLFLDDGDKNMVGNSFMMLGGLLTTFLIFVVMECRLYFRRLY